MEIVVVGAGRVGEALCFDLIHEGHELTLIDQKANLVLAMTEKMDLKGVVGNGTVPEIQREADVASCDVFISATPVDEVNIVACIVASRFGAKHCIARIRNPEYTRGFDFRWESIGIDLMMNTEQQTAREIVEEFDFPNANYVEPSTVEGVQIIKVRILPGSTLAGMPVLNLRRHIAGVLICVLQRGDQAPMIPRADMRLEGGDRVHVIGTKHDLDRFQNLAGHKNKGFRSVFIIGGGITARYLIPLLLKRGITVRLIERDRKKAERLALEFPKANIVSGDGTDQGFLNEQRLSHYDVSVALTSVDEENLLFSLYAHRQGVRKTITRVTRSNLIPLLDAECLDTIITPQHLLASSIIRYVRSLEITADSEIEDYHRLENGVAEAVTFKVKRDARIASKPLRTLQLKKNTIIALIKRGKRLIVPAGDDMVQEGDSVIVLGVGQSVRTLDSVLTGEAKP
ncbi:MAG: Trk system potassium transporter TrkA [Bacillota bacterium]|nr:Trk system potassium transporter TrkA [Bacillota bacterium]